MRAEGFSYILDVLYGGLGIDFSKAVTCYSIGHQNIGSGSGSALKIIRIHNTSLKQQYLCIDIRGEQIIGIALIHFFQYRALNKHQRTEARGRNHENSRERHVLVSIRSIRGVVIYDLVTNRFC